MAKRKSTSAEPPSTPTPPLRLEWVLPESLDDNPANWRTHPAPQIAALEGALEEVGWAGALLFNERTQRLIDGHARKKLALGKGEPVPVLVGNWSEAQEQTILATLDPIAAMATSDAAKLDALLRGVQTQSQAVAEMLGDLAARSNLYLANTSEEAPKAEDHWKGMPEFEQQDMNGIVIHVHMETEADVTAFEELIGGKVCRKSKSVWFPWRADEPAGEVVT